MSCVGIRFLSCLHYKEDGFSSMLMFLPCIFFILGVKHKSPMTVEDCYELAKIAYSDADYYHTELWMAQALKQLDEGEVSTLDKVTVLDYLSYAIYQQGEIERALDYTKMLLELGESLHNEKNILGDIMCSVTWTKTNSKLLV